MKFSSYVTACFLSLAISAAALAQSSVGAGPPPDPPVPHDQQLREAIQKLTTTGRMMMVVAHPDDEDGPLLTYEARARGNQVMLFTFTRGEGGQDATGAIFGDELGLLRTMELLASDKDYGVEQRFSRVADFGFSKTPEETFAKWGGKDVPLGDLVRQIRLFRPGVLVARFSGTPRDGHGHHQASSILTQEAFKAAADPKRFPGQNLPPWQCKKLYIENVPDDQVTLRIDTGAVDPVMGESPAKVALQGLRHQASQGLADIPFNPARAVSKLKLIAIADGVQRVEHETDVFDGLDTSPVANTGPGKAAASEAARDVRAAADVQRNSSEAAVAPLAKSLGEFRAALEMNGLDCDHAGSEEAERCALGEMEVHKKVAQAEEALQIALRLVVSVHSRSPALIAAGSKIPAQIEITNGSANRVSLRNCEAEQGSRGVGKCEELPTIKPGASDVIQLPATLNPGEIVQAPFHREHPLTDTTYQLESAKSLDQALPPPSLAVRLTLESGDTQFTVEQPVTNVALHSGIFLAPTFTVISSPSSMLRTRNSVEPAMITLAGTRHDGSGDTIQASFEYWSSPAWAVTPLGSTSPMRTSETGMATLAFHIPADVPEGQYTCGGELKSDSDLFKQGVHLLSRPDLDAFPYYFPAKTTVSIVRAEVPPDLTVGYIMGAGDNIPDALASLGVHVTLLTPEELAHGDLSKYSTIVTGIRSYATRKDLRDNNARLLDYVRNGGTMVVQYEQDWRGFNAGHYTPYPMELGNIRADQEELPVTLLHPDAVLFHAPNTVTEADFHGWIQEYGLYFADKWDPAYEPLLSMHDEGEPPHDGALLRAHYGKGVWIYSGLAMFRQVPNGVPGATRLFLNMLSAGHTASDAPVISARVTR